jgi:hypothetical protein
MHRLLLVPLFAAFASGACLLPDLDETGKACPCGEGFTCDAASNTCVKGGGASSGAGGASASASSTSDAASSASSTAASTSSASSGAGGSPALSNPLVVESIPQDGTISLRVDGNFRIQSTAGTQWQWSKWFDLGSGSAENLASTLPGEQSQEVYVLFDPLYVYDGIDWYDISTASVVSVDLVDQAPARAIVDVRLHYDPTGLDLETLYTVYASGRVATWIEGTNGTAGELDFNTIEYNYLSVNPHLSSGPTAWQKTSYSGAGAGFLRVDGPSPKSSALMVDTSGLDPLEEDAEFTNWSWGDGPAMHLMPGDTFSRTGQIQIGPGDQTGPMHAARTDDVLGPGLQIVSGGLPIGSGYDDAQAAYAIQANTGATSITFGATNDRERFDPSFVIEGFDAPSWRLVRDGKELVSSSAPVGPGAVAYADGRGLVVVTLLGDFPAGAPEAERLVTLEAR